MDVLILILLAVPLFGALVLLFIPKYNTNIIRYFSFFIALLTFFISIYILFYKIYPYFIYNKFLYYIYFGVIIKIKVSSYLFILPITFLVPFLISVLWDDINFFKKYVIKLLIIEFCLILIIITLFTIAGSALQLDFWAMHWKLRSFDLEYTTINLKMPGIHILIKVFQNKYF